MSEDFRYIPECMNKPPARLFRGIDYSVHMVKGGMDFEVEGLRTVEIYLIF